MTAVVHRSTSPVLSRHSAAPHYPWRVQAENANAWSRLPASPFADGLILMPNHPDRKTVSVIYGPLALPKSVDSFAFLTATTAAAKHGHVIGIGAALMDDRGATVAEEACLSYGERAAKTLALGPLDRGSVRLRFQAWFDHFEPGDDYGVVRVLYVLAYEGNVLVDLLNAAGSDKGTTHYWGRGVPHCYAVEYHRLFEDFRHDHFAWLEIGLDNKSPPADAPSLRAWRDYFPSALLYGYDIEDFSFFVQRDTFTFRGDQASRVDLQRFVATSAAPPFRVILDDGSHASSHQQISLAMLFPHLEAGGLYIVEDLNWQPFPEAPTTLEVLRGFIEGGSIESVFLTSEEARYLEAAIDDITIYRPNDSELAVIKKASS